MANSIVTDNEMLTPFNSHTVLFSKFTYATSGDAVLVPRGCIAAAVLESGSWTTAITAGADNDSVVITGGTLGTGVTLVTKHGGGNPASAR